MSDLSPLTDDSRRKLWDNFHSVHEKIQEACARSSRSPKDVTLVAVTKYADVRWVHELVRLGIRDLGEARPQQLVSRSHEFPADVRWHLIGHLQRNKAEDILPVTHLIHSVDSLRLFEHLAKLAAKSAHKPRILLEVNVTGEGSKDGFDPTELLAAWPVMHASEGLNIAGLMTMAPLSENPEDARPAFRRLRDLRDQLHQISDGRCPLPDLSMGMSGDFEVAIEEGATIIRVGSRLFEGLEAK